MHNLHSDDTDVLAITETWLNDLNGDSDLRFLFPSCYIAYHVPRKTGCGGGVAVIVRNSIDVHGSDRGLTKAHEFFESFSLLLRIGSVALRLPVILPPTLIRTCFLQGVTRIRCPSFEAAWSADYYG